MAGENKIFAVIATSAPTKLEAVLLTQFPDSYLLVGVGQWLVVAPATMTTQELSNKIGVSVDESVSNAIVLSVNSYFGRAPLNVWEWLNAKMGDTSAVAG